MRNARDILYPYAMAAALVLIAFTGGCATGPAYYEPSGGYRQAPQPQYAPQEANAGPQDLTKARLCNTPEGKAQCAKKGTVQPQAAARQPVAPPQSMDGPAYEEPPPVAYNAGAWRLQRVEGCYWSRFTGARLCRFLEMRNVPYYEPPYIQVEVSDSYFFGRGYGIGYGYIPVPRICFFCGGGHHGGGHGHRGRGHH